MFCTHCGSAIPEGAKFCPNCGQPAVAEATHIIHPAEMHPHAPVASAPFVPPATVMPPARRVTGWCFIGIPLAIAILSLLMVRTLPAAPSAVRVASFGILILSIIAVIQLLPIGIVLLFKKDLAPGVPVDERSGKGEASDVPLEIQTWNWGAAFLGAWWGVSQSVWLSFLGYVPFVSMFWWIIMGIYGNEWAWRKRRWASVAHFTNVQRPWNVAGIVMLGLQVFLMLFYVIFLITVGASSVRR